ncbi:hypothetical protein EDD36DRAFT_192491 [Exophiala viscosa]|uniref:Uncharacterized protein n=1 Tax=Exophiala viscosa TaxID=2486360 RepID=A0AAN6DZN7_9EURO|nr:hypothetical protein EDD36DRAFT_192491 [Exophiala viscosa]
MATISSLRLTFSPQMNSTLLVITFLTILASIVPFIFVAKKPFTKLSGSRDDADFLLTIQTSCMQLLSLFTTVYPVLRKTSIHNLPWAVIRTWALAVLGLGCCVAAPVLYYNVPVIWSCVLSYLGAATQACLVLQLALLRMHRGLSARRRKSSRMY